LSAVLKIALRDRRARRASRSAFAKTSSGIETAIFIPRVKPCRKASDATLSMRWLPGVSRVSMPATDEGISLGMVERIDSQIDVQRRPVQMMRTRQIDRHELLDRGLFEPRKVFEGDKKVDKEIEKAEKELAKGDKEASKGKFDKAIDKYKKAWEHAQKALKKKK